MSKTLRVLIVEDSEDDAELILHQLERSNYEPIYQRVDNSLAMTLALEQQQWDVVLADYSLPKFSATAALSLLQEKGQDLPFIIVSACIGDEIAVAAMKAGAHDYIMKNNLARLVPAIERELQEAASRRDRQQIQAKLKESEARWQLALQGANDGIWDWNIKTNEVFFSLRWKEMLGYTEEEIADRVDEWMQRMHPEDREWVTQAIQDHLVKKTQFYKTEHRLRCKDGSYKWILSRGQALWDEIGNPTRMVGSHTDITPTKQLEAALRQQAESLAEANRLKDEFLAIVSHELRTPLNPILGWAQTLLTQKPDAATTKRALESIERSAKLQKRLVDDILDVSHIIRGKLRLKVSPTNLISVIEAAIETVRTAAEAKAIQLQFLIDPSLIAKEQGSRGAGEKQTTHYSLLVLGDANRLQQVIWNLLANAIKFTPEGGRVEVRLSVIVGNGEQPSQLPITNYQLPITSFAQIQVIDTGIGISPDFLPYAFDRFRQEDSSKTRSYSGLGLGLAIVRHLVELHGGKVCADSPGKGQGTTFTIELPLLEGTQGEQPSRGAGEQASRGEILIQNRKSKIQNFPTPLTGWQILVVDDNADNLEFLVVNLIKYGANAIAATSVGEALEAFKRFQLDVLISDIGLPGVDGYDLIRQVRMLEQEQGTNTPAVALSGYARKSDRNKALKAGFQLYLSKPIEIQDLVSAIAFLPRRAGVAGGAGGE